MPREKLRGTRKADEFLIDQTTADGPVQLGTGGGNDTVTVGEGGHVVDLGSGNDTLLTVSNGLPDALLVFGGEGSDRMEIRTTAGLYFGDEGNDRFTYDTLAVGGNSLHGGKGRDAIDFSPVRPSEATAQGVTASLVTGAVRILGGFSEPLFVSIESLTGTLGRDNFTGNDAANVLDGRSGNDVLIGLDGDDVLIGGEGLDLLSGGAGADRFVFKAAADLTSNDFISDFDHGQKDKIDVSAIDTDAGQAGDQGFDFIGDATFAASGNAAIRQGDDGLEFDFDGDGIADATLLLNSEVVLRDLIL